MTNTHTLKPVYQRSSCGVEWAEITFDFYSRYAGADGFCYRILYPAAAYESLQKENNSLKLGYKAKEFLLQEAQKEVAKLRSFDADNKGLKECNAILTEEIAAQAKRIAELENQISIQMNFGERMIINSDGDVVGDDTGRVVAKFSHWNEAESFCEAANFKYSASKNGD